MKKKNRRRVLTMEERMSRHGWVFVSPVVIGFLLIYMFVIGQSFLFSFQEISPGDTYFQTKWVGFQHYYTALFVETGYLRNLAETTLQMLYSVPLIIIFSLFVATLLNQRLPGRSFFRAVFFIPAVLVTGAIADSTNGNTLMDAMNELEGVAAGAGGGTFTMTDLQNLFGSAMLNSTMFDYLLSAINNIFGIVKQCGVQILIFIAGLQSQPPSIYEAAAIEGANGWDCYWKITFPLITPMIFVNAVYSVVDSFTSSSNVVMTNVYELGIAQSKIGYASAYAWMYFLVVALMLGLIAGLMKLGTRASRKGARP